MIYFTKAVDYSLRALIYIARHPHESVDVKAIAKAEEIPEVFLAKLLQKMKRAGLISSKRGVGGGFVLDKHAVHISVIDVIHAVEGFDTMHGRLDDSSPLLERRVWRTINRDIFDRLSSTSVAALVADSQGY